MSKPLERRLRALEGKRPDPDAPRTVLMTWGVPPGAVKPPVSVLSDGGALEWRRGPSESEDEFFARAEREAPRNAAGFAILVERLPAESLAAPDS
jgi:hypothetical protein